MFPFVRDGIQARDLTKIAAARPFCDLVSRMGFLHRLNCLEECLFRPAGRQLGDERGQFESPRRHFASPDLLFRIAMTSFRESLGISAQTFTSRHWRIATF